MIFLASFHLARDGPQIIPPLASLSGFAPVFGTTVYAFMCHHSLPGLITPMRRKSGLMLGLVFVYLLVVSFYLAISVSGSFAFRNVFDVYSLEFLNNAIGFRVPDIIIGYFLAFFPVFTLTTNFPIVATTLCNNLYVLLELIGDLSSNVSEERERLLNDDSIVDNVPIPVIRASHSASASVRWLILFFVLFIPMVISLSTDNVLLLSALTGSYPGVGVQFVIPCLLIIGARRYATEILEFNVPDSSSSPFKSFIWPWAIFIWSLFTVIMVTLNLCELR
ncbi:hypothetical protein AB6A40_007952 [Gnathostoma spinigerum]|uniref:Amino acid transporter transmembrane domain-containing protein n=1 Tax=Gnathostoma spinigerum TaxID=75299 RepID=A0ABD6EN01_9BILA